MAGAACTMTVTESNPGRGMPTKVSGVCSRWVSWRSLRVCPRLYTLFLAYFLEDETQKCKSGGESILHILGTNRFLRMMAYAPGAAQKDHRTGNALSQDHRIMTGAAD